MHTIVSTISRLFSATPAPVQLDLPRYARAAWADSEGCEAWTDYLNNVVVYVLPGFAPEAESLPAGHELN